MLSWFFSEPLPLGSTAPDFTLLDQSGSSVMLSKLRGHNVVLVFYPADETRVCRKQLCEFRDLDYLAREKGILVYGVNPASAKSHLQFRDKENLPFPLLVDEEKKVAFLYKTDGWIIRRTVYLIGPDGTIRFAERGTPAAEEVLRKADSP